MKISNETVGVMMDSYHELLESIVFQGRSEISAALDNMECVIIKCRDELSGGGKELEYFGGQSKVMEK